MVDYPLNEDLSSVSFFKEESTVSSGTYTQTFNFSNRSKEFKVELKNNCKEKIYVAVNYQDENDDWITTGWWGVDSNSTSLTSVVTSNRSVYFYAYTVDGLKWNGNNKSGSISKDIPYKKFESKNNTIVYPLYSDLETVSFFKKESNVDAGIFTQAFACDNH